MCALVDVVRVKVGGRMSFAMAVKLSSTMWKVCVLIKHYYVIVFVLLPLPEVDNSHNCLYILNDDYCSVNQYIYLLRRL